MSDSSPRREHDEKRPSDGPKVGYGTVALIVLGVAFVTMAKCNARQINSKFSNDPADPVKASMDARGQRTFAYWSQVNSTLKSHHIPSNASSQEFISRLRAVGRSIQHLPTLGVDDEAVDYAQTVAEAFDRIANFAESNSSIGKMAEYFLRGLTGDTTGGLREINAQSEQVAQWLQTAENKGNRVRALLTRRHGVEFPSP